jgi:hypothetical protein
LQGLRGVAGLLEALPIGGPGGGIVGVAVDEALERIALLLRAEVLALEDGECLLGDGIVELLRMEGGAGKQDEKQGKQGAEAGRQGAIPYGRGSADDACRSSWARQPAT